MVRVVASRKTTDLALHLQPLVNAFLPLAERAGLDLLVYCTRRSLHEQAVLFRKGRPLSDIQARAQTLEKQFQRPDLAEILLAAPPQYERNIVTHAAPGQSLHNYGLALDCVPMDNGKPAWAEDAPSWLHYGAMAKQAGLAWAGDWDTFREFPHIYLPGAHWRDLIRQGKETPDV